MGQERKRKAAKRICFNFLIFLLVLCAFSCREKRDEELIADLIGNLGKLAEKRDVDGLMSSLSENYSDFAGRDKSKTRLLVENYFKRYRGIVVHVLSTRIDKISGDEANIQTEMAFSSGAAEVLRKLVRASLDNYRFHFTLIKKKGEWQIQFADWTYINLNELYPESLSLLKKIFPEI